MAAHFPQMLTANRLRDGEVVWWARGEWVVALKDGEVFADQAAADIALKAADAFVQKNIVVNPYLFDVRVDGGKLRPVKERELIRAGGPSVHENLGKQADHVQV
jgi:hypothetical protein